MSETTTPAGTGTGTVEATASATDRAHVPDTVGVYGGGRMGAGIAHAFATAGAHVIVIESTEETVAAARDRVDASIAKSEAKGIAVPGRVDVVRDPTLLDEALLVIEAVPEDVALKQRVLADIVAPLQENFAYIAADARLERQGVTVAYDSRIDYSQVASAAEAKELLLAALERRRTTEIERGLTLHGPGRDDIALMIGSHPAKGYASHGETWSLALAMQLAGWDLLSADAGTPAEQPILVLDDVFAELDTGRRSRLASRITEAEQVLVTAAVDADLPDGLGGERIGQAALLGAGAQR